MKELLEIRVGTGVTIVLLAAGAVAGAIWAPDLFDKLSAVLIILGGGVIGKRMTDQKPSA